MPYDIIIGRTQADKEKFGDKGLVYIGKGFVKMGTTSSLSNKIWLDVARNHVILVAGKRGSGKSYTLGAIAEELSNLPPETSKNIASLMFDTMGIFWTMKYKNEKDRELLDQWGLKAKELPVKVFVPFGRAEEYKAKEIPFDETFALKASELEAEDWISVFNLEMTGLPGVLISRVLASIKEKHPNFSIQNIQEGIIKDEKASKETKEIVSGLFSAANDWGIFSKSEEGTEVSDLITAGTTTILDTSVYSSIGAFNVRALVISLVCRKIFKSRMDARKKEEIDSIHHGEDYLVYKSTLEQPLVWIFIDECVTGDNEIITAKNHTKMIDVINNFEKGEKVEVLGYDQESKCFAHYPVNEVYRKGKRKIIKITTETGRTIKCTPEHRVLTRGCFASAFSVKEIATPLIQHYSEDEDCIKARILGHLYGDGWASEKTQSLGFSGKSDPEDLIKIKNDLEKLGLKSSNIYSRETESNIIDSKNKNIKVLGTSHSIQAATKAYRYFKDFGIILGDKAKSKSTIPSWIKQASPKVKAEFLAALMGSDGNRISKAKYGGDFNPIRFSFNKLDTLEKEAKDYAEDIKKLFESIDIKVSKIKLMPGNIRKNGDKTIKIVITLDKSVENTIRFLDKVGYRYCSDKEIESKKWSSYLQTRSFLKNRREELYNQIKPLLEKGMSRADIAKKLGLPDYTVQGWAKSRFKPGIPKKTLLFEDWIKGRVDKEILYEKVTDIEEAGEEEVYDISVEKAHNFVSNGIVAHNCHEFLEANKKTPATDALIQLLREGRQPGISMIMATQQPGKLHADALTQADIIISHRVTAKPDVDALNHIMQSYLLEGIKKQMDNLPTAKGSAIILDDNSERLYPMRVRPKFTWHGGESPSAVKAEFKI